jgi:pyruvate dehydrogenase E2 component (dihydrolipoamide acetyltransferase)
MATPVELPKLGNTVEECIVSRWRKHKGEPVSAGEIIADVETDKATFELPAPVEGTLLELFFEEGSLVPVFTNLCVIGKAGESVDQFRPAFATPPNAEVATADKPGAPRAPDAPIASASAPSALEELRRDKPDKPLSPRARWFAQEHDFRPHR